MKKIYYYFVLPLMFCLFTACGHKIKMSDLQFKVGDRDNIIYVYYEDKTFDGEAWSDDGSSFKITVDCGIMARFEYFDEDGNLFYAGDFNDREEMYFNEKGGEITERQARELYPQKFKHFKEVWINEFNHIINQKMIENDSDENVVNKELNDDAPSEAEQELSIADIEINKTKKEINTIHEEINTLFDKLIKAREKMEHANETLANLESGTDEYKNAEKEKTKVSNEIQKYVDLLNKKYVAKYCGYLMSENDNISLYESMRDKIKAVIAREIYIRRKQETLDEIDRYYGY